MLAAKGLYKTFGAKTALQDVDITVKPGTVTVLIGPSGAGKTTLLRCLGLLDQPDRGFVSVDDATFAFPRSKPNAHTAHPWPDLTVVFQQHFLWPHLTMRENILLPARHRGKATASAFTELVDLFEMAEFIDRYPNEVSIGERQRVALARALVLEPKYILLDEITSALDVEHIHAIFKHLLELRSRGIGMLLITHLLGLARGLLAQPSGRASFTTTKSNAEACSPRCQQRLQRART